MIKRKKLLCRIIVFGAALAAAAFAAAMILKPDWRYIAVEQLVSLSKTAELTEASQDMFTIESVRADELAENGYSPDQSLMLINKNEPLADDFSADVTELRNGVMINSCAAEDYNKLSAAVKEKTSQPLWIMSSYRTAQEQEEILSSQGSDTAMPSECSEHRTGLALDVYTDGYAGEGFLKSEAGQFVNSNCWEYGFIIRYPFMSKKETGIDFEPWHIRYTGLPHSEIISKSGKTFEEYIESLEYGIFYTYGDYVITHQRGDILRIPQGESTTISYDNMDGYIITTKLK